MNEGYVDVGRVMRGLKDFQRASVDYVFRRMYLDPDPARRFLLADEVGLGKTMVARGVVARVIDHLKDKADRIDVLYICSNLAIARQNIARLNVTGENDFSLASRITLLPKTVKGLKGRRLNFITFTPSTSFQLMWNLGQAEERALLHRILRTVWGLKGTGAFNLLQGNAGTVSFRRRANETKLEDLDESLMEAFSKALEVRVKEERERGTEDLRSRFDALCESFAYARKNIPADERRQRVQVVGELRNLLAASCIEALEPDLIVLDEFQRFRDLLHEDDDASTLARNLFAYKDVRILLLSATPYKMYTLTDDEADEDHYRDFVRTYRFLAGSDGSATELENLLGAFRKELVGTKSPHRTELVALKTSIESMLRLVMCRTERLASDPRREGMLVEIPAPPSRVILRDLEGYLFLQRVSDALQEGDVLEYWMAAPFALNFMERYKLKESFDAATGNPEQRDRVAKLLASAGSLLLDWQSIENYAEVDPGNSRLRHLLDDTIGRGSWRTLWMPPSLPYYQPGGPFDDVNLRSFTKRLVFSSWKVVPKVIAGLLSYEAERLMILSSVPDARNTPDDRRKRKPLLRFSLSEGRLTGMPVLALIYPSGVLARCCDPMELASSLKAEGLPDTDRVLTLASSRVEAELSKLRVFRDASKTGEEDEAWYWAAPLILDAQTDPEATELWWDDSLNLALLWSGGKEITDEEEEAPTDSAWAQHVDMARKMVKGSTALGRPPADLPQVLALMGLAAPGTVALRALRRVAVPTDTLEHVNIRFDAARIAYRFPPLFNQPESTALVRGMNEKEPFWRRVAEYCAAGNLQAVMDEYCHLLKESLGLVDKPSSAMWEEIANKIIEAMSLRAAPVGVDSVVPSAGLQTWTSTPHRLRMRFALRYGDEKAEDGERLRADQVRTAFNSPFWPFVLATTSVGQEGLDFHHYCHAVVHWNLPSNPVDLEQREGRVHRYKGHAVRKNLSSLYGETALASLVADPWQKMFELADRSRPVGSTEIFPFWILPLPNGARIERHVLALPLSREVDRLSALRRSLAVYRMVFGQPRQEELLEFLERTFPPDRVQAMAQELRIDLSPTVRA